MASIRVLLLQLVILLAMHRGGSRRFVDATLSNLGFRVCAFFERFRFVKLFIKCYIIFFCNL
jgi:hypothetical protein